MNACEKCHILYMHICISASVTEVTHAHTNTVQKPHMLLVFQGRGWAVSKWPLFPMKKCCKLSHQMVPPSALRTRKMVTILKCRKLFLVSFLNPCNHKYQLTPLSRVDDDNFAERPISLIVVHSNLHFKWGKRRESLVSVLVRRRVSWSNHLLLPASGSIGTKCNDIPKALTILELLRHRLKIL